MVDPVEFRLNGDAEAVRAGLRLVVMAPPLSALSPLQRHSAEIVLAEVLNNIVEHAYAGKGGPIRLRLSAGNGALHFRIEDRGSPMPGGRLPPGAPPDPSLVPEGGYGWFLIHCLARDLAYSRREGTNHVSFTIPRDEAPPCA